MVFKPCSFCAAECCKSYIITATAFDILRIEKETKKRHSEFATLHQARLLAFDPDTTLDMEDDGWVYILGMKSHPCVFLAKDDKCTIHEVSPLACMRFPFMLDNKLNTRFCPLPSQLVFRLSGPDLKTDRFLRELSDHKKIVKEWNAKPGRKSECMAFLLRRASELSQSSQH